MWRLALGGFLVLHGLIHLGYVTPTPVADPRYPFNLGKSWLITAFGLDDAAVRLLGLALSDLVVIGFALAGMAAVGFILPSAWATPLVVVSAVLSLVLLLLFWNAWLVLGVLIDLALLVGLLLLRWNPFGAAA